MILVRAILFCALLTAPIFIGCEKQPPRYRLKIEKGHEAVQHFDQMSELPRYNHEIRTAEEKRQAIAERRQARDKARGIYRKESLWDY